MKTTKKVYNLQSLNFLRDTKLKIGILGGSFNPAHKGHLNISINAINLYNFDYIIWLVANQNPLKPKYEDDIFIRSKEACKIAKHNKIIVSSAEHDLNSYYLYDSLQKLTSQFSSNNFTWLMGVDNKSNFHKWYKSENIMESFNIIIFDRPSKERYVCNGKFDLKLKAVLASNPTTNIIVCKRKLCAISSSQIRKFLRLKINAK